MPAAVRRPKEQLPPTRSSPPPRGRVGRAAAAAAACARAGTASLLALRASSYVPPPTHQPPRSVPLRQLWPRYHHPRPCSAGAPWVRPWPWPPPAWAQASGLTWSHRCRCRCCCGTDCGLGLVQEPRPLLQRPCHSVQTSYCRVCRRDAIITVAAIVAIQRLARLAALLGLRRQHRRPAPPRCQQHRQPTSPAVEQALLNSLQLRLHRQDLVLGPAHHRGAAVMPGPPRCDSGGVRVSTGACNARSASRRC
jgi:hypothetical protein